MYDPDSMIKKKNTVDGFIWVYIIVLERIISFAFGNIFTTIQSHKFDVIDCGIAKPTKKKTN